MAKTKTNSAQVLEGRTIVKAEYDGCYELKLHLDDGSQLEVASQGCEGTYMTVRVGKEKPVTETRMVWDTLE